MFLLSRIICVSGSFFILDSKGLSTGLLLVSRNGTLIQRISLKLIDACPSALCFDKKESWNSCIARKQGHQIPITSLFVKKKLNGQKNLYPVCCEKGIRKRKEYRGQDGRED